MIHIGNWYKNDILNDIIKPLDEDILKLIRKNKYITGSDISKRLSRSEVTIQRHLSFLSKAGYLRRVGSKKNGYWEAK